eukprot:11781632-Ditylum_brightwellii.AAC.1
MEDIARENNIDPTQAHMASNLQRVLPSLLSNNAGQALISVPQTTVTSPDTSKTLAMYMWENHRPLWGSLL